MKIKTAMRLLKGGPKGIEEWNRRRAKGEPIPSLRGVELGNTRPRVDHMMMNDRKLAHSAIWTASVRFGVVPHSSTLTGVDLRGLDLRDAMLFGVNLQLSMLDESDLSGANLMLANLTGASLRGTNLTRVLLFGANLGEAILDGAVLNEAVMGSTILAADLSLAEGLDSIVHKAPSFLSVDTVQSALPEGFLRGCGLQDEEITYFCARAESHTHFYSCFISYSTRDEGFATRLHNDLQAAGIRCWKWDHDARTGHSLWKEIDQAIRIHDKLVLIASESSLNSPTVNREIERAIRLEDEREEKTRRGEFSGDPNVLFPVRLDDYIFKGWEHERKVDVTKKVVADARGWDANRDVYTSVRDRLIRDLKSDV
jgi:uncharacterized protein YjbI with pentapeptide repeats